MRLTNFTDYALRTMIYLASFPEKRATAKEISEHFGISYNHVAKVIHHLARAEFIISHKGKGGGINLIQEPKDIQVSDIVKAVEPDFALVECFTENRKTACRIEPVCKLKNILWDAKQAFVKELDQYTLADITDNQDEIRNMFL